MTQQTTDHSLNHLERGVPNGYGKAKGRYKDGREYEIVTQWSLSGVKTLRRGKRKDGRWTDWYYINSDQHI